MSPKSMGRLAGLSYLVIIVTALLAEMFVRGPILRITDPAGMADALRELDGLYRLGGAAGLATLIFDVLVAYFFYEIFKPAGAGLSLLTALFRLVFSAAMVLVTVFHFLPLVLLSGAVYLDAFHLDQLQALARLSLRVHGLAFSLALVFFGVHCLLLGWLIVKSRLLPRLIGWFVVAAGAAYLVNTSLVLLSPATANVLFPFILLPAFVGEVTLTLWLLAFGVNAETWTALRTEVER